MTKSIYKVLSSTTLVLMCFLASRAGAVGTEIGSFTIPLAANLGGQGLLGFGTTGTPIAVLANTANTTLTSTNSGYLNTTTGATALVQFTLPTPTSGANGEAQYYMFYCDSTLGVTVVVPSGVTITMDSSVSATGGSIQTSIAAGTRPASQLVPNDRGCFLMLVAVTTTNYVVVSARGSWTVV